MLAPIPCSPERLPSLLRWPSFWYGRASRRCYTASSYVWSHQAGEELVPATGIPSPALVQAKGCAKIQLSSGLARLGTHLGGSSSVPVPCSTGTSAYWASADTGGLPQGRTSRKPTGGSRVDVWLLLLFWSVFNAISQKCVLCCP